jgi:predicted nucleic acid-binding protein
LNVYADTSLLLSLYVTDAHSREAQRRVLQPFRMWLTPLHQVEWAHAITQKVFRHAYSSRAAVQFYADFEADRQKGLWLEVAMRDATFETAIDLAKKHVAGLGYRTLDTLHVASALELGADEFWSFDSRQLKLARAAGLKAS